MRSEFIPILLTTMQTEEAMPAVVFSGKLEPARKKYMLHTFATETINRSYHFKECNTLIQSLCRALGWLHFKRLVHMEVSVDSVMVSSILWVHLSSSSNEQYLLICMLQLLSLIH